MSRKQRRPSAEETTIHMVPVTDLIPSEYNPRKADRKEVANLTASIREFGLVDPLIVNANRKRRNRVIGGHFRLRIATDMGYTTVPVIYVDIADEAKERELNLRLNKNLGAWDWEKLAEFDIQQLIAVGFDPKDLAKGLNIDNGAEEDEAPEPPPTPTTKPGDLYLLGEHRLLCGDATSPDDIAHLMDGHEADMLFTDPPYGVNYQGGTKDKLKIQNDDLDETGTRQLLVDAFRITPLRPGGSFYICSPAGEMETTFRLALLETDLRLRQCLVWVKDAFALGHSDYHYQHESVLYGWRDGGNHDWYGGRTQSTCWEKIHEIKPRPEGKTCPSWPSSLIEIPKPRRNAAHPTMKPVELVARAIRNSSKHGDIVLDCFAGSGSTAIAAEQSQRRAFLLELDPRYADVIVARWEKHTGGKAKRA